MKCLNIKRQLRIYQLIIEKNIAIKASFQYKNFYSGNMLIKEVIIKDKQNPLFRIKDEDFISFFLNLKDFQ